jgi:alpha-tubulin suppressor-like RCC1 family protein
VAGGLKFRSLTAGSVYTCGVTTADVGYCWGSNFTAQLGDGTTTDRLHPTQVGGALALASIRASRGNSLIGHTCATTKTGSVYCWGNNSAGQLALTTTENCPYATGIYSCARLPVAVPGLSGVLALDLGTSHSCAVVGAGQLMCWGDNSFGELGDGTQAERTGPVVVAGLKIP